MQALKRSEQRVQLTIKWMMLENMVDVKDLVKIQFVGHSKGVERWPCTGLLTVR